MQRIIADTPHDFEQFQLCARFDEVRIRLDGVTIKIAEKMLRQDTVVHFLSDLMKQPALVTEFDPMDWHTMVEVVTIYNREGVRFMFKDGTEIVA